MTLVHVLMLTAFASWSVFAVIYGLLAPWWRSPVGRNYLALAVLLASILGLIVWSTFVAPSPAPRPSESGRTIARVVIYGATALLGLRHLGEFVRGQLEGRRARLADDAT